MKDHHLELVKGIHPGFILERELSKRDLAKVHFAVAVGEYPQTLVAIMKGRRRMNTPLSLKIEKALGWEEGTLMQLQVFYDIKQVKRRSSKQGSPDLSKFRRVLFWDTDFDAIDWHMKKRAVIKRVFERGNNQEREEVIRFYGSGEVRSILHNGRE